MKTINRFKSNIESFIIQQKKIHNDDPKVAKILGSWDEIAWGVTPRRFRFCKFDSNFHLSEKNIPINSHISDKYIYFCKAYFSYLFINNGCNTNRFQKDILAYRCISKILESKKLEIFEINREVINEVFTLIKENFNGSSLSTCGASICSLIQFLISKEMLNNPLSITNPFKYNPSCTDALMKNKKMLPSKDVILAVADIYNRSMPKDFYDYSIF